MSVLGINRRNALIARLNTRAAMRRANDKLASKAALDAAGLPVSETLLALENLADVTSVRFAEALPDTWVLKPNRGQQGDGIVIAREREGDRWRIGENRWIGPDNLRKLTTAIVLGNHAGTGAGDDIAFFEPLIEPHPDLAQVSAHGLPDIRVIVIEGEPVMAMLRMPTRESGGRANLHQGALGLALDLHDGHVFRIVSEDGEIGRDDPRAEGLHDYTLPCWDRILDISRRCCAAMELGYLGADLVIDAERGVLVLEVNAHPGIEIQNVNGEGLRKRVRTALGD